MTDVRTCPECGSPLPADAPDAPCPVCLMKLGLESWSQRSAAEAQWEATRLTPSGHFEAPLPEELAARFPQLEILELLGQGGMGAVYKARQMSLNRLVALKIIKPDAADDPDFGKRFTREAQALARLNHPHIVTVHEFGQADGLYYFIMEFVDGTNARQLMQSGNLEPRQALEIIPAVCDALQFAHDEGIVHRDIKPENILIDTKGRVKIADFGLARLMRENADDVALTQTRQVMGTPRYMAPEQMEGSKSVDHRADIYSLGVVFYEMLTGELPLGRFAPPSQKVQVDVRLDEVVLKTLEKEPDRRYQHASDVKTAVEVVSGSGVDVLAAAESRPDEEPITGWAVVRQSFLVLLSIAGTLTFFMPWTLVNFGHTFPDGGGSFVQLAAHGVYHWFPIVGSLLAAALLFVTLSTIGCGNRPLRAILSIATGLALTSMSLFTIAAKPLTVHPEPYIGMVTTMDEWSSHGRKGASALAELVRLSQTTDHWTPGNRHVTIHAEPFVGTWIALGSGLLLLVLGTFEFTSVVSSSLNRMAAAPLQTAAAPAHALRLTGMLGPAALLIVLLMNMADVFINGGGARTQPWSLLRTLLIWSFGVHLFQTCFITPWILFGANRLKTLSSPGAVRTASILAMLPLSFAAFVGIPAGLWSLLVLNRHTNTGGDGPPGPAPLSNGALAPADGTSSVTFSPGAGPKLMSLALAMVFTVLLVIIGLALIVVAFVWYPESGTRWSLVGGGGGMLLGGLGGLFGTWRNYRLFRGEADPLASADWTGVDIVFLTATGLGLGAVIAVGIAWSTLTFPAAMTLMLLCFIAGTLGGTFTLWRVAARKAARDPQADRLDLRLLLVAGGLLLGGLLMLGGITAGVYAVVSDARWLGAAFGCFFGGGGALFGSWNSYREMEGALDMWAAPQKTWFDHAIVLTLILGLISLAAGLFGPATWTDGLRYGLKLIGGIVIFQSLLFGVIRAFVLRGARQERAAAELSSGDDAPTAM